MAIDPGTSNIYFTGVISSGGTCAIWKYSSALVMLSSTTKILGGDADMGTGIAVYQGNVYMVARYGNNADTLNWSIVTLKYTRTSLSNHR